LLHINCEHLVQLGFLCKHCQRLTNFVKQRKKNEYNPFKELLLLNQYKMSTNQIEIISMLQMLSTEHEKLEKEIEKYYNVSELINDELVQILSKVV
jgi:hypothetical protein